MAVEAQDELVTGLKHALAVEDFNLRGNCPLQLCTALLMKLSKGKDWGSNTRDYRAHHHPNAPPWIEIVSHEEETITRLLVDAQSKRVFQASLNSNIVSGSMSLVPSN